ncbi:MAG: trypsin-like peptidase domain-containing protein [Deltaproteobacteria bacterium]|nr:trypsin-like peptidase domain-containing protein [Deltaproteobacteria bacterium]
MTALVAAALALFGIAGARAQAPTAESQGLFQKTSPLVFQVKTAVTADAPKASYGSGFVVAKGGILATNYHVVAEAVQRPENYKMFVVVQGAVHEARVVAVDVIHDLALVKLPIPFDAELALRADAPRTGDKLYSVGIPHDLNLSIVEGLYNGVVSHAGYEQIQMSTPINPGMSGGPTLSSDGLVAGVNVAVMVGSQNLTFGVPVRHLSSLLESWKAAPLEGKTPEDARAATQAAIEKQLLQAQAALADDWRGVGQERAEMGEWRFRKPPPALKCWLNKVDDKMRDDERQFEVAIQICSLAEHATIRSDFRTAYYWMGMRTVKNLRLNRFQFSTAIDASYNDKMDHLVFSESPFREGRQDTTRYDCGERVVVNSHGVPFKMNYCLRGYYKYKTIFDVRAKFVTLAPIRGQALVGSLMLSGLTLPNASLLVRDLVESVEAR